MVVASSVRTLLDRSCDLYQNEFAAGEGAGATALDALAQGSKSLHARIFGWIGPALSVAMLFAVVHSASGIDLRELLRLPASPGFWICLLASYLATPASEWIIYRRLWNIPREGFVALLKKQVSNELLMGYLGEVQFYLWARKRTEMTGTPFGAVKDVSILSAMAGNAATVLLLAAGWPYLLTTSIGIEIKTLVISLSVVLVSSIVILFFRRRLFSLARQELLFITGVHFGRIAVGLAVMAGAWHLLLPDVPLSWLLLLAMLRMLVSRLPLLPNKDVVFAAMTVFLLGTSAAIGETTTKIAVLTLAMHIVVGALVFAADAEFWKRAK